MTLTLHDGATGKLYGCVRYSGRFHPEIVIAGDGAETLLWRGGSYWDVHIARLALAETVALAGLCFWPAGGLNDNGRELGVSPWVEGMIRTACTQVGMALIDAECRDLEALIERVPPRCPRCGNLIDPDCCGCGSPITHDFDGHSPVPMGCDCGRVS